MRSILGVIVAQITFYDVLIKLSFWWWWWSLHGSLKVERRLDVLLVRRRRLLAESSRCAEMIMATCLRVQLAGDAEFPQRLSAEAERYRKGKGKGKARTRAHSPPHLRGEKPLI